MPERPPSPWKSRPARNLRDEPEANAEASPSRREVELRIYGLNAVRALFARRPQAMRKLYLAEARIPQLQPLLRWCVANRIGYRVVADEDLQKLAASSHHEGVVADVLREEPLALTTWLRELPPGPQLALWLDGVGNPHNLGAILRSAAHFGVAAILLPKHSPLALSGAAARVAEGGAEAVPFVRLGREDNAIAQLRGAGFALAATLVRGGTDLFAAALPARLVYVLGAESRRNGCRPRPDLRFASVHPRQRRGGKPQRRRRDGGAAGDMAQPPVTADIQSFQAHAAWLHACENDAARYAGQDHETAVLHRDLTAAGMRGFCAICDAERWFRCPELKRGLAVSLRESLRCEGCGGNARQRAAARILIDSVSLPQSSVYFTEQASRFYLRLGSRTRRLQGSEFVHSWTARLRLSFWLLRQGHLRRLRREDVTRLSFRDRSFDAVVSLDVLEHVPDYRRALARICACLEAGRRARALGALLLRSRTAVASWPGSSTASSSTCNRRNSMAIP